MSRPRALDLFCGAGGASVGLARAGFEVVGVDIEDHPSYPYELVVADAREVLQDVAFLRTFDLLYAGPPCQELTRARHLREAAGRGVKANGLNLIPETREGFQAAGRPYVIENVEDALPHLKNPVRLCGQAFGLPIRRHRLFESDVMLFGTECYHPLGEPTPVGLYGQLNEKAPRGGTTARTIEEAREAMGIDWMRWRSRKQEWHDLKEAIPPSYTEYLAGQLL